MAHRTWRVSRADNECPSRPCVPVATETDELRTALDDAAGRWPEDRSARSRLLLRFLTLDGRLAAQAAQFGLGAGYSHRPKRSRQ